MLKVALASRYDGQEYCAGKFCEQPILITQPVVTFNGVFKSTTRSSAGTSTIAEPLPKSSILLTDLILTSDRVALATVTVRFTDGTNNVDIITAAVNDAPVNLALSFGGRWQGWKDARVDLITVGNATATVACGYMKVEEAYTLHFNDWDSRR